MAVNKVLLTRVQAVEHRYQSVKWAPDKAMMKVWRSAGVEHPPLTEPIKVPRRTYAIIQVSVGHGLTVSEIAKLINRSRFYTNELVDAYRHNLLEINEKRN